MLYMAFVAVANYTQPNFELGYAAKIYASSSFGFDGMFQPVWIYNWVYFGVLFPCI